jgi:hypothetical protein
LAEEVKAAISAKSKSRHEIQRTRVSVPGLVGSATLKVPFASMGSGRPNAKVDPSTILTVQWQLGARSGGPGCSASFMVDNAAFYWLS